MSSKVDSYILGIKAISWYVISPEVVYSGRFFNHLESLKGQIFRLFSVDGENFILKRENTRLSQIEMERNTLADENIRLRGLLDLKQKDFSKGIAAEVIARDMRDWFQTVVLDKGEKQGVVMSAAVLTGMPENPVLVGRIKEISANESKVLLLTDALSAVSVSIVGRGDFALLQGHNRPGLVLHFLPSESQVTEGDLIVTAGLGGVFPPNIPIGTVSGVFISKDGYFKTAEVKPLPQFSSFREVLILERKEVAPESPS